MKRLIVALSSMLLVLSILTPAALATAPPDHMVTVCHRTGSVDGGNQHNGYDIITVDIASSGYVQGGHDNHDQVGNGPGPDIIPAYDYTKRDGSVFNYPGFNLNFVFANGDTGAQFLANGCQFSTPPPPPPVVHHPTLVGSAVCDLNVEKYTVTYNGNKDGAVNTVPDLPVVHVVAGTSTSDSATVNFKYSDGPDVSVTDTVHMAGNCTYTPPPPEKRRVAWEIKTNMPDQYKSGYLMVDKNARVTGALARHCGYMVAKIKVDGAIVKQVRIHTNFRTIVHLVIDKVIVAAKIGKAFGC